MAVSIKVGSVLFIGRFVFNTGLIVWNVAHTAELGFLFIIAIILDRIVDEILFVEAESTNLVPFI